MNKSKKIAAAISAVMAYIKQEEAFFAAVNAEEMVVEKEAHFHKWCSSGRHAQMQMRSFMQMRAFQPLRTHCSPMRNKV